MGGEEMSLVYRLRVRNKLLFVLFLEFGSLASERASVFVSLDRTVGRNSSIGGLWELVRWQNGSRYPGVRHFPIVQNEEEACFLHGSLSDRVENGQLAFMFTNVPRLCEK